MPQCGSFWKTSTENSFVIMHASTIQVYLHCMLDLSTRGCMCSYQSITDSMDTLRCTLSCKWLWKYDHVKPRVCRTVTLLTTVIHIQLSQMHYNCECMLDNQWSSDLSNSTFITPLSGPLVRTATNTRWATIAAIQATTGREAHGCKKGMQKYPNVQSKFSIIVQHCISCL